ncbi:MobF family relaxase [Nonomuraea sp. NPDC026600]|uniref:MobF family relaxase n=1 Tax=Nonomuraea sp. NPDC026600 TaxID=3155363 RepID=UPI0033E21040
MTVKITAFSVGEEGVAYFLHGEGCGGHKDHEDGPEQYFLAGQEGNFKGRWFGGGLEHLGLRPGTEVSEADAKAVFGHLAHPVGAEAFLIEARERIEAEGLKGAAADAELEKAYAAARLGSNPYKFKTLNERVAARAKKEHLSDDRDGERIREIRLEEAKASRPRARGFYDVTFSPAKSTSIFYAGLLAGGREAEAEQMREIHREAVQEALAYLEKEAGYARAGHHGQAPGGRSSVGRWVEGHDWTVALWDHQANREGEPQLHTHAVVLNRVRTVDQDGTVKWRALDGASLFRARRAAAAVYERGLEQRMENAFAVAYALRPDGKAREIVGISEEERAKLSTRSEQVSKEFDLLVEKYKERHGGEEPSAYGRTLLQQAAARNSRARKELIASSSELFARWERMVGQRLKTTLAAIVDRAEAAAVEARGEGDAERWETEVVIQQAIERVQDAQATWTRSDLMFVLNEVLPDRLGPSVLAQTGYTTALLEELADEALSGRYGTVMVRGMELLEVPEELRRADGRSMYRPGADERYATVAHLSAEQLVETRARSRGAKALPPDAVAAVLTGAEQDGRPLGEEQAEVVSSVLGGGRDLDVVVGPAGTGKSVAQGTIATAWKANGGRVIGLAPSQKAAHVLRAEGVPIATNTTRFLLRASGKGPRHEIETYRLRPGDLVILDEAGMVRTDELVRVVQLAAAAGAKVVLCGDHSQLTAVGAGGLFRQLVNAGHAVELGTVRRFRDADGTIREWEAKASLGLREGQVHALQPYLDRGRLRSGSLAEMVDEIRGLYVSDALRGVHAAVMTSTEEQAAQVAAAIRGDLVRLGRVAADGVDLADGTQAGVGDLVQARENLNRLKDSHGMPVYNRFNYRVTARHSDGALTVQRVVDQDENGERLGGTVRLKASYVAAHVTLAYAGTVHSVQGATVDGGYSLFDAASTREQLYVAMTRGARENRGFVALEADEDALSVLTAALARVGAQESASDVLAGELEWIESLGAHAPVWTDLVEQHQHAKHASLLMRGLGIEAFGRLEAEDASTVYRQLWAAEQDGHDTAEVIRQTTRRDMRGVDSVPAVMYSRIAGALENREPERPAARSWLERTPADMTGPEGEAARARAAVMDERVHALGERAVAEPPAWALERLGPVPEDPIERHHWQHSAAVVEAYREQYQVDAPTTVIGAPPSASMVPQFSAWQAAHRALGRTAQEQELATSPTVRLQEQVAIWRREQEWAPPDVADELARAEWKRLEVQTELALDRARLEQVAEPEQVEQLRERVRVQEQDLQQAVAYGQAVEAQYDERANWHANAAQLREAAQAAFAELVRRKADIPEAERTSEPAEVTPPEVTRDQEAFGRLADRWAGREVEKPERSAEPVAEVEPSLADRDREALGRLADRWAGRESDASTTPAADVQEQTPNRALSEVEQGQEAFGRLADRWAGREVEEPERSAEPVAEVEPSLADRDREALGRLSDKWTAEAAATSAADLRPQVSVRVIEELQAAQDRVAADREQAAAQEATRQQAAQLATDQQAAVEQMAERTAASREAEPEMTSEDISREQHYEQQQVAEVSAPVAEQQLEYSAPVQSL